MFAIKSKWCWLQSGINTLIHTHTIPPIVNFDFLLTYHFALISHSGCWHVNKRLLNTEFCDLKWRREWCKMLLYRLFYVQNQPNGTRSSLRGVLLQPDRAMLLDTTSQPSRCTAYVLDSSGVGELNHDGVVKRGSLCLIRCWMIGFPANN